MFWKQQYDLPAGIGCRPFGKEHIISLVVIALFVALKLYQFGKSGEKTRERVLNWLPVTMAGMELFKDAFLRHVGRFDLGYLPLHLCSLGIFLFLITGWIPRARPLAGEIALTLILPGSAAALLFPDWIGFYPVWNFMNLYSFLWHALLVLYPLLLYRDGYVHPDIRHIWRDIAFLLAVTPFVYMFDLRTGCNYFFLMQAPEGTPLAWIAAVTAGAGRTGYLAGYGVLVICILAVEYGVIHWVRYARPGR